MKLIISDDAQEDLADIFRYISKQSGSRKTAHNFTFSLVKKCREIANQPFKAGRLRPELDEDLRSYIFDSYLILFRYADDMLEIVAFIEGHRDIEAIFND